MLQHIKKWLLANSLIVAIGVSLLIIILSLISSDSIPKTNIRVSDKVLHALAYLVLMWSWLFYLRKGKLIRNRFILLVSLSIFGIILEVLQDGIASRTADWKDIIANVLGLFFGIITFSFVFRFVFKKEAHDVL